MKYLVLLSATAFLGLTACATSPAANDKMADAKIEKVDSKTIKVSEDDLYDEERDADLSEEERGDKIICKKYKSTGTNVDRGLEVCKSKRAWDQDRENSKSALSKWNSRSASSKSE